MRGVTITRGAKLLLMSQPFEPSVVLITAAARIRYRARTVRFLGLP
jgi:hypothetical protein